jgi:hypothetical protein
LGRALVTSAIGYFLTPQGQQTGTNLIEGLNPGSPGTFSQMEGRISGALASSDLTKQMEGKVGQALAESGLLKQFDTMIGGRQIDAVAGKSGDMVVEVTTGSGRGKIAQALGQMKDTCMQVVIYGENLSKGFVREAQKQGISVAQNLDQLKKLLGGQ